MIKWWCWTRHSGTLVIRRPTTRQPLHSSNHWFASIYLVSIFFAYLCHMHTSTKYHKSIYESYRIQRSQVDATFITFWMTMTNAYNCTWHLFLRSPLFSSCSSHFFSPLLSILASCCRPNKSGREMSIMEANGKPRSPIYHLHAVCVARHADVMIWKVKAVLQSRMLLFSPVRTIFFVVAASFLFFFHLA